MLTVLAGRQVAAGMSISVWVEIAAATAGSIIKDSFSVLSEIKGDTFQVSCMYHVPLCAVVCIMRARQPRAPLPHALSPLLLYCRHAATSFRRILTSCTRPGAHPRNRSRERCAAGPEQLHR